MLARLARAYVYVVLFTVMASAIASAALQFNALTGFPTGIGVSSDKLLVAAFLPMAPCVGLAKERNVWKSEFSDCPWWMRAIAISSCIYGFLAMLATIGFRPNANPATDQVMPVSAFTLGFDMICLCVLHSVLWSGSLSDLEVMKRARNSAIAGLLTVGFVAILIP